MVATPPANVVRQATPASGEEDIGTGVWAGAVSALIVLSDNSI